MDINAALNELNHCKFSSQSPIDFDRNGNFTCGFGDKEVFVKVGDMFYPIKDASIGSSNLGIICHISCDETKGISQKEVWG